MVVSMMKRSTQYIQVSRDHRDNKRKTPFRTYLQTKKKEKHDYRIRAELGFCEKSDAPKETLLALHEPKGFRD